MKLFKKIGILALGAVLSLTAFGGLAGCKKKSDYDISILFPLTDMNNATLNDNYNTRLIEEITGYKVKYNQIRTSNEETDAQQSLTHRDQNHIMKLGIGSFDALVGKDLFLDLKKLLDDHGPNIKAAIPQEWWNTVTYNGKIYGIPETSFSPMQDNAIIINKAHLAGLGKYDENWVPETIEEFTTLLADFKEAYGTSGKQGFKGSDYRAFGIPGTMPECSNISSAFELPRDFYEDENGKVQSMIYSDAYVNYVDYMNSLRISGYMRTDWSGMLGSAITSAFANNKHSVAVMPYWDIKSMTQQMAANNSNIADEAAAKANISYTVRLRGDGTHGSVNQTVAKYRSGIANAFILAIPFYMEDEAVKAIDFINKKLDEQNLITFLVGKEGETFEYTDSSDPSGIEVTYNSEKVQHGTKYYKLLDKYKEVERNSMYATGSTGAVGKAFWPLREASYDVWDILTDFDDTIIIDVMATRPILAKWGPQQIKSKSFIFSFMQNAISAENDTEKTKFINNVRTLFKSGYWTSEVEAEVNAWYSNRNN